MTDSLPPIPIVYFDTNSLHCYRIRRPPQDGTLEELNQLMQYGEDGAITCVTSTFTRLEMLNFAKKAAYAAQELEAGRTDLDKIMSEIREKVQVQPQRLAAKREEIDKWLGDQATAGRLRMKDAGDHATMWRLSEILMEQTSLAGIGDCIHAASAILLACSVFVTQDRHLRLCVGNELLSEGDCRKNVQNALAALTGADELSLRALSVHEAHVFVSRHLAGVRNHSGKPER